MKLEDICNLWEKDSKIDIAGLDYCSVVIPQLHAKYYKLLINERLLFKKKQLDHKKLVRLKFEYYTGKLSQEELQQLGWKQCNLKIIKSDLPTYIDADDDVVASLLSISAQQEKMEYLLDILKMLHSRGYQIKNAIEFMKYTGGN